MNYYCAYWVSDSTSAARREQLRRYFDLQRYCKRQIGAQQIIATNLDYPDAEEMHLPARFRPEHALVSRWFALKRLIEDGLEFPLVVHDHDTFVRQMLPVDEAAILSSHKSGNYLSEQLVVFPSASKPVLLDYLERLEQFDFVGTTRHGYGSEVRHEGAYSSEQIANSMSVPPFGGFPIKGGLIVVDHVSYFIQEQHSLDIGTVAAVPISNYAHAVHSHINKGPISDSLIDWLSG